MELSWVILKPVLTEKAAALQEKGVWSFFIHPKATKGLVKKALEEFFGVHPVKIRIINLKPKKRFLWRQRREVLKNKQKKALVWLPEGEKIKEIVLSKEK